MRIAIYGLGYVGLTAAGCLTKQGHHVVGVDVNEAKIAQLNAGVSPITEPGLDVLLAEAVSAGALEAVGNVGDRLASCEMAIVCVGTPSAADGSHDLSHIVQVSRQIASSVNADRTEPLTVVYRSTIRPGTIDTLIAPIFREVLGPDMKGVELVYNPEFLREAVAIKDFFAPSKIVIGTVDGKPNARMESMNAGLDAPVFHVGYREAEFTKFVDNSFHALKVTFANEIGRLAQSLGVDPVAAHRIFVADTKLNISANYLRPGGAFGGSCLPKDVRALQHISVDVGTHTPLIDSVIRSNEAHKLHLFHACVRGLPPGAKLLMIGLAFKADSDDLRESPNVDLARRILDGGYQLAIHDPWTDPKHLIGKNLGYAYAHLPNLGSLMVDKATAETGVYDRVIDTNGRSGDLALREVEVVDLHGLRALPKARIDS
jgi:GDP-mannose 6-dehydrogenase